MAGRRKPETWVDNFMTYGVDTKRRWMFAGLSTIRENPEGEVGYSLQANFHTCLHLLEHEAENPLLPITIELCGYGGDIYHSFGIHNRIEHIRRGKHRTKVHIHAYGPVMSAASVILMAADVRLLSPEAYLMTHWPEWNISGRFSRKGLETQFRHAMDAYDALFEVYWKRVRRAGMRKKELMNALDTEMTYHARQAVQKGFADGIIGEWKPAPKRRIPPPQP